MTLVPGRFVLVDLDGNYVTSFDTWEQCAVAFDDDHMPSGHKLIDEETRREWLPGARYEWEAART